MRSAGTVAASGTRICPRVGRRTVNTVPTTGAGVAVTVPLWALVIDATMERPRPAPP